MGGALALVGQETHRSGSCAAGRDGGHRTALLCLRGGSRGAGRGGERCGCGGHRLRHVEADNGVPLPKGCGGGCTLAPQILLLLVAQIRQADVVLQQNLQVLDGVLQADLLIPGYLILELRHQSPWRSSGRGQGLTAAPALRAVVRGIRSGITTAQDGGQGSDGHHTGAVGNAGRDPSGAADRGAEGGGDVVLPTEGLSPLSRQVLHVRVEIDVRRGQQVIFLLRGILLKRIPLLLRVAGQLLRVLSQWQRLGWLNLGLGQLLLDLGGLLALEEVGDHGALAFHIHAAATGKLEATPLQDLLHLLCYLDTGKTRIGNG